MAPPRRPCGRRTPCRRGCTKVHEQECHKRASTGRASHVKKRRTIFVVFNSYVETYQDCVTSSQRPAPATFWPSRRHHGDCNRSTLRRRPAPHSLVQIVTEGYRRDRMLLGYQMVGFGTNLQRHWRHRGSVSDCTSPPRGGYGPAARRRARPRPPRGVGASTMIR